MRVWGIKKTIGDAESNQQVPLSAASPSICIPFLCDNKVFVLTACCTVLYASQRNWFLLSWLYLGFSINSVLWGFPSMAKRIQKHQTLSSHQASFTSSKAQRHRDMSATCTECTCVLILNRRNGYAFTFKKQRLYHMYSITYNGNSVCCVQHIVTNTSCM